MSEETAERLVEAWEHIKPTVIYLARRMRADFDEWEREMRGYPLP